MYDLRFDERMFLMKKFPVTGENGRTLWRDEGW